MERRKKKRNMNHRLRQELLQERKRRRAQKQAINSLKVLQHSLYLPINSQVKPNTKCKLRQLKLERIKDYLLMEEEFITNQERLKPTEEKIQVCWFATRFFHIFQEERSKLDDLRGSPMMVGNLEEIIDDNHAIVSSSVGTEYYVTVMSCVDRDQLFPGSTILLHNKV
jgi:26S proteasome regulatory subunit T2